jgi:hypothetical protein
MREHLATALIAARAAMPTACFGGGATEKRGGKEAAVVGFRRRPCRPRGSDTGGGVLQSACTIIDWVVKTRNWFIEKDRDKTKKDKRPIECILKTYITHKQSYATSKHHHINKSRSH